MSPLEIIEHSELCIELAQRAVDAEKSRHDALLVSMLTRLHSYLKDNPILYKAFGSESAILFKFYTCWDLSIQKWSCKDRPGENMLVSITREDPYGDRHSDEQYSIGINESMLDSSLSDVDYDKLFTPWRERLRIQQNKELEQKMAKIEALQKEIQNLSNN
jgi:hypothetical protein